MEYPRRVTINDPVMHYKCSCGFHWIMCPMPGTVQHRAPTEDAFVCNECGESVTPKYAINCDIKRFNSPECPKIFLVSKVRPK